MRFHHLGVGVRRRSDAIKFLASLGYTVGDTLFDPLQKVHLTLCTHTSQPTVELIEPGSGAGPLDLLLRQNDGIAYHCCYSVPNIAGALQEFEDRGLRVLTVSPVKPAVLFPGFAVSFHQIVGFGLIELVEPLSGSDPPSAR